MGNVVKIGALVLSISFFVFTIFFGRLPALRNTPIGFLNRLVRFHIPSALRALDNRITNGRIAALTSQLSHHFMNDRHPTVLVFFILLLSVSEYCWVPSIWPTLGLPLKITTSVIISAPYIFLFLSSYVDPGYITRQNLDFHGTLYPYDYALYLPGHMCRTCNQLKPPRSKHCSICGHCVSRLDHHCIFINGCVGYGNAHFFVLLLLTTAVLTTAGTYLGLVFLRKFVQAAGYPHFTLRGTGLSWSLYFAFWSYVLQEQPYVGGVTLLCLLTSPLIYALYLYNIYLIFRGMTTNETGKWGDFQLDCDDGYVFRRPLGGNREIDTRIEPEVGWPKESEFIYVRTNDEVPPLDADIPGEGTWHRVWSLKEVNNLYDLGFLRNAGGIFLSRATMGRFLQNGSKGS